MFGSYNLAGPAGFEPAHARIKTWCLTAWRRPNYSKLKNYFKVETNTQLIMCYRQGYSGLPALHRYFTHPWVPPYGPAFGCSNSILSNLSGHQQKSLMFKIAPGNFVKPAHARIPRSLSSWCLTHYTNMGRRPNNSFTQSSDLILA